MDIYRLNEVLKTAKKDVKAEKASDKRKKRIKKTFYFPRGVNSCYLLK